MGECKFEKVKCPDPNCRMVMIRGELENHQENKCQWRVIICDYCGDKYAVCKEEVQLMILVSTFHLSCIDFVLCWCYCIELFRYIKQHVVAFLKNAPMAARPQTFHEERFVI